MSSMESFQSTKNPKEKQTCPHCSRLILGLILFLPWFDKLTLLQSFFLKFLPLLKEIKPKYQILQTADTFVLVFDCICGHAISIYLHIMTSHRTSFILRHNPMSRGKPLAVNSISALLRPLSLKKEKRIVTTQRELWKISSSYSCLR